ncbi:MAG: tetratricopeptide repeat protein [Isosphaerales bacterium]
MSLYDYYDRLINWPGRMGLIVALSATGALLVAAIVLLAFGKVRRFARALGLVGVVLLMVVLWFFHDQTITEKQGPHVTLIRYTHSRLVRLQVDAVLIGLPVAAAVVMAKVLLTTRRRLLARVPRLLKMGRRYSVQKEYAAALREYNEAIRTAPDLGEAYFRRGSLYQTMGETVMALADYDRAIERDPRLAAVYLQRGKIRTESGDFDNALADFQQFMNLKANDPDSYLQRGICLVKKGMLHEAAADFRRVLKLTNHSDFAEPAKNYLRICQGQNQPSPPPPSGNGSPRLPSPNQPKAHDLNR